MKNYLSKLEQENISYSLATIYVGIKLKMLDIEDLAYYVDKQLSSNETNNEPFIALIVEDYTEQALIHCMHQLNIPAPTKGDQSWEDAIRVLRYAYLTNLLQHHFTDEILLEKIASYYEDMHCPHDMAHFIYYMPSEGGYNSAEHSIEDNRKRLVTLLKTFLTQEKKFLVNRNI